MTDTSATVARRWPSSSRPRSILHVSCCRHLADRKPRGGAFRPSWLLCALVLVFAATEVRAETTIYVGKHFEVRDHHQPTKYIFNGSTRVARITGSLSTNTRIQRFRLRSGWNLLSLAVTAPNALRQLTNSLSPILNSQSVVRWNQSTLNWLRISPNETLPAGTVLWANAATNTTIAVTGTYSDPVNRQIEPGTTYLASTGLEAWTPTFPLTLAAWSFNSQPSTLNSQPSWHARLTGDLSSVNELPRTFAPGQALYVIANAPAKLEVPDLALRIRYYHQDHLGSSSVMTDADGMLVEEAAFYPFGEARNEYRLRPIEEFYKFTQKERDEESDLHYFESRYLAAPLSRFITPDRKYADSEQLSREDFAAYLARPQKCNLYAYVNNNPVRFVDPDGHDQDEPTPLPKPVLGLGISAELGLLNFVGGGAGFDIIFVGNGYGGLGDLGLCGTVGGGAVTPGASLTGNLSFNLGGLSSFKGSSTSGGVTVGGGGVVTASVAEPDEGEPTYSVGAGFGSTGASLKRNTTECITFGEAVDSIRRTRSIYSKLDTIATKIQRLSDEAYRSQVCTFEGEVCGPEPNVSTPDPTPQRDSRSRPSPQNFGGWLKQGMKD